MVVDELRAHGIIPEQGEADIKGIPTERLLRFHLKGAHCCSSLCQAHATFSLRFVVAEIETD
jgi:hypothetical protein